jgi:rhomboid family GlyGly-CTERM serine protease
MALLGAALSRWGWGSAEAWDWQATRIVAEPWRLLSAAFVHLSAQHLLANLAGAGVLAAFGWAARSTASDTAAWLLAWPLGHALLRVQPGLTHYAGLSGVLHAGVAVAAFGLLLRAQGRRRAVGAAVLAGLALKLLGEQAWRGAAQTVPQWDFPVAVAAHASGAAAGLACAAVAWVTSRRAARRTMR